MMKEQLMTCPLCGKSWKCAKNKDCEHWETNVKNSEKGCPCESCGTENRREKYPECISIREVFVYR